HPEGGGAGRPAGAGAAGRRRAERVRLRERSGPAPLRVQAARAGHGAEPRAAARGGEVTDGLREGGNGSPPAGIAARGLVRDYGRYRVVNDVSIDVHGGEVVGLLGPNGAGKTTTFYMIVGLLRPTHGRIVMDGRDITEEPVYLRARGGLGYLAQEP